MNNKIILAVIGPTASGKTAASIALAKRFEGEIICCDSMQIYKHMKIGTASPNESELAQAKHHLFNCIEPSINYNAALYQKEARRIIDDILSRNKTPILCGGTGLYVKAALYDMNFPTANSDDSYRKKLEKLYDEKGAEYLHDLLKEKDSTSAKSIHANNVKRVIRALEIYHLSGVKKSEQKQEEKKYYGNSKIIALKHDRNQLYGRINKRVELMVEEGLEDEVKALVKIGISRERNAMQAIGYKEFLDFFDTKVTYEECIYNIKLNSRHYAKRQLTWFNRMDVAWYDYNETILQKYMNIIEDV